MKTLLDIAKAVAVEIGVEIPATVTGDDPDAIKMVQFINATGVELARRVDWSALNDRHDIVGTGSPVAFELAGDHDRLAQGLCVTGSGGPVRGSITADEWFSLLPVEGAPRYFRSTSTRIMFYPYPAAAEGVTVSYQSRNWAVDDAGNGKTTLVKDRDAPKIPCPLFIRGAVWRWMRHVGRDFNDHMGEYEAQLADYAKAEGGIRQP
jgi:hypothetical protein